MQQRRQIPEKWTERCFGYGSAFTCFIYSFASTDLHTVFWSCFFPRSCVHRIACNFIFLRATRIFTVHAVYVCRERFVTVHNRNASQFIFCFSVSYSICWTFGFFFAAFWICVFFFIYTFFYCSARATRFQERLLGDASNAYREFTDIFFFFSSFYVLIGAAVAVFVVVGHRSVSCVRDVCISSRPLGQLCDASIFSPVLLTRSCVRDECWLTQTLFWWFSPYERTTTENTEKNVLFLPWNWISNLQWSRLLTSWNFR